VQNATGVDLELDAHPRHAFGRGRESQREPAQAPIVRRPLALALQDVDEHVALMIHGGRKHLSGFNGDGRVARDQDVHQAAKSFQPERERSDVKQKDILEAPREYFRLDGGAQRHGFVGVLRGVQARAGRLVVALAQAQVPARLVKFRAAENFRRDPPH